MSRTAKTNPKDYNGGGCREYWSNRPHNKGGSEGVGKRVKKRTAKIERSTAKLEARGESDG